MINRALTLPAIVTLVLLTVLAALVAGASAVSAQGSAPDAPDRPVGTAVFVGGVDLEWNDVPGADSYGVQMYRNGQWTDLPGDSIEIAFYGAGAIISELEPEGSSYWFRVRARSVHGFSEWSDFNFMASTNESKSGRRARPDNVPASGTPVISGTAQVGESLTADTSDMEDGNGLDRVQFRFQWVSHDGSADTDIANGTDSTYTLVADDAGKTIKVRVSFTDRGGYAESLTGGETATVPARPNSPATGAPAVTGTAQVGETLAADISGIGDTDGLTKVSYSYQWVANDGTADTDITDATDSTYTLVADDEGKTVKVRVSFTDDAGNVETLTSTATNSVAARPDSAATGAPTISGTSQVGEALTADTSGIGDADGLTNVSYSYQWIRSDGTSDADITDAADSTYTLVAADEDKTIKVRVSFTDDGGNEEALTSAATTAVAAKPNTPATGLPTISGTARVGETLTADMSGIGDADGLTNVTYSYQWIRNDGTSDTAITRATHSTYTLAAADEGKTIRVRVSFTDDAGFDETLTSAATEVVGFAVQQQIANSAATGAPTITGTAQVGETLTADTSGIADTDELTNVTYSYQWIANDGISDTDITGATDSTYTLVAADEGQTIKVKVSFTDDAGNGETLTSTATSSVAARANTAATGAPTISGTAQVGEILSADTSGIGDADGLTNGSYSYQWIRNDGSSDTDITDAADSSYTLVAADEGKTIKVRVSFTDDAANEETLTSTATEAVSFAVQQQIANSPATGAPTISGAAQVGEALTADTSGIADTDGLVNATFRYQWMRNDGTSETDIQNATGSTYTLVDNDEGQTIKVKVSFTDDAGNDETLSSGATDAVAAPECDNIGDCDIEDVDDLLLPDLVSYQHDYSVAEVVATPDGTEFFALRFAGFVTNLGDGPLDLRGNPQLADDADLTSHDVWQRALTIDGDWVNLTKPPIDFEVDDGHDHFHVMGIVEYSLWDTSGTVEISSGAKIGFCLIDVMERPDLHANPGPKRHEQWDPDNYYCQSGRPRAKILHMGISEGWQDIYSFSETFQWIDVSDVQPGYYRIGQRVDPDNVIVESDETNNELVLTQRLQVVPGYVARPEMVSVEPDAAVRFKLSVDEYFDDTNLEDGSPRTRAHRIVTQPSHGSLDVGDTVTVIVDGATHQVFTDEWVTYTPDPGYAGVDSFTFVALDESLPRYPINPVVATVTLDITGAPTIRGTAQVGETLTADTSGIGDTDSITGISYSYQWVRNDGTNYTDITGATDPTYTMVAADEGRTIKVGVSFTDDAGNEETLTSAATSSVTARPEQGIAPNAPDLPIGTAVFVGGVDLEWNEVPVADSYEVQLYQNGQWIDLPGDGVEIAFYGAGAIISGLDPSLTLWFQVRARNAHGSSDWSDFSSLSSTNQFTLGKRARSANEAARGAPVINGTAQVGEILTADTTGIEDGNGLDRVQFRFQWATNDGSADTDIAGATNSTYTLAGSDEGKTIKVRVAFTDRGGYAESLTSDATETVSFAGQQQIANNPATGGPIIGGTARVGETLATDVLGIADEDGLENATFSYQWISNDGTTDADIQGETGATYTLTDANKGKTVKVRVSFTDDADNEETVTSAATATVAARPNRPATGAPIIGGTVRVGETLATDVLGIADEDGLENATFSYQWISNDGTTDADIQGETGATYTLTDANEGKTVKVRVSFTDDADNEETVTSAATATVAARPNRPATGAPIIGGTVRVGETLATDVLGIADEDGLENATFSYQWISNDGTTDADIQGETGATYTLTDANEGKTVKVRVSFTDDADNEETVTSAATATVAARPNRPATGAPIIGGTVRVGETLATDVLGIADEDGLENATFSYQWISNDGTTDADIQGETGATYTLASAYVGKTIKVKVTFTDDADNEETLTSPATAEVAAGVPTDLPAKPRNLTGTANADGTVTLRWDAPDDDSVTGYQILRRRPTEGERTLLVHVNDTGSTATEYTDNDVTPDVLHTYRVTTINAVGLSRRSEFVNVTPTQPAEPAQNAPATGTPTISGNAQVGETLTADTSGIADADGLIGATYSYQWIRSDGSTDTDIQHATGSTYTLVEADEGQTIKVEVSFTDDAGNDETLSSGVTDAVAAPEPPAKPTGLSAAAVSHDAVTLAWDDPQDDAITGYIILRRDREIHPVGTFITITGDTGSADTTYTDDTVEPDKQYNYKVKAINEHGEVSERSDWVRANTPAVPVPDKPTGLSAAVSHDAVTLTWDDPQDDSITGYVILRRDRAIHPTGTFVTIAGDTGSAQTAYTDETVEPDKKYVYRIKAINDRGLSEMSLWLRTDTPNWATGAPTIGGNAQVGETLTAGISEIADEDGLENAVFSYQWVASNGTTDTNIAAATDSTYDLVAADAGKTIKVRVSFTDDAGNEETLTSTATDIVSFAVQLQTSNSPATGAPVIAGTIQVGETLTADTSSISDADGLTNVSYQYQWLRNDGNSDSEIAGATDSTYALADDDEGNTVKVRVSFTDDAGTDESLTSPATATVAARISSPATGVPSVTGTAQVGRTLTADTSGIADADGLTNVSYSYQWVRTEINDSEHVRPEGSDYGWVLRLISEDIEIAGATNSTYTLVAADGRYSPKNTIKVRVSFTDDKGNEETLTSTSIEVSEKAITISQPYEPPQNEDSPVEHAHIFPLVGSGYGPDGRTWELEFAVGPLVPDDDATTKDYIINYRIVDENGDPLPNCEGDGLGGSLHFMTVSDQVGGNQHSGEVGLSCRGAYFALIEVLDGNSNFIDRSVIDVS